jgi:integrase
MEGKLRFEDHQKLILTLIMSLEDKTNLLRTTWLRDYVLILLGLEAGLRAGESTTLKISMVYQYDQVKSQLVIPANFNKFCKAGVILLSPNLRNTLSEYVPIRISWLRDGQVDGYLISNKPGKRKVETPLTHAALHYIVRYWAKRAGIDPFRYHDLRHRFANAYLEGKNSNIRCLQDLMRHKGISSTAIYTHPTPDQLAAGMKEAFKEGVPQRPEPL